MLDRVLIAARGDEPTMRRRMAALAHWYGLRAEVRRVAGGAVTVASLAGPLHGAAFGEAPPATLDLLGADDRTLRRYEGGGAALAATADRARLVAGAGAPAVLYAASGTGVSAWATHAVAAAYVATGGAVVNPDAVPELLAAEFVGGDRSLVAGVRALKAASYVDLTGIRAEEGCYWPARERWRLVPEEDAYAYTEHHLLESLDVRLAGIDRAVVGLTGGTGSRAAALALRELGVAFEAITWGSEREVRAGAQAAEVLGVKHRRIEDVGGLDLAALRTAARWTEGAMHAGIAAIDWPRDVPAWISGAGCEAARRHFYADRSPRERPPQDPAAVILEPLAERIAGARPEALQALEASVRRWVADADRAGADRVGSVIPGSVVPGSVVAPAGARGWRLLDVVCAEQRIRRRLRAMLPPLSAPLIAAFTAPEVQRGLVSLPGRSGFERRFIEEREPRLLPPTQSRRALPPTGPAFPARWAANPEVRDWIADAVLGGPLANEAMGERWCGRTRSRFYAGDPAATDRALWLAGPVALGEALADLPRVESPAP